jgi:hypothetical protein
MIRSALAVLPLLAVSSPALAKDLRGRFGGGFNQQFGAVSALSLRYAFPTNAPAVNIQLEGAFGLETQAESGGRVFSGGRLLYGMIAEDNMNLFVAGGVGALIADQTSTIRLQPTMGADFFFFGLENLGFTVEWGLNLDLAGQTGIATTAAAGAGVHYWF